MSLRVVAHVTARPDTIEQTKELLLSIIGPTREEPGCISYQLHLNNADPAEFTFIEEWVNEAALDEHFTRPHMTAAFAKVPALVAAPPDIRRYSIIG
jgi:quinol monooxygenase YgiN